MLDPSIECCTYADGNVIGRHMHAMSHSKFLWKYHYAVDYLEIGLKFGLNKMQTEDFFPFGWKDCSAIDDREDYETMEGCSLLSRYLSRYELRFWANWENVSKSKSNRRVFSVNIFYAAELKYLLLEQIPEKCSILLSFHSDSCKSIYRYQASAPSYRGLLICTPPQRTVN